jgi:ferrous iron transport protein A
VAVQTSDETSHPAPLVIPLAQLRRGEAAVVSALTPVAGLDGDQAGSLLARLRDLGFVHGARCEVVARMWPAGDPLAVRIGGSTFALRGVEADAVRVTRLAPEPARRPSLPVEDRGAVTA